MINKRLRPTCRPAVSGFTLIEVLVVISIIAILAAMVVGIAGHASRKSDIGKATADMEKIKSAAEEFRVEYGRYPTNGIPEKSINLTAQLWVKPWNEGRKPFMVVKGWSQTNIAYAVTDPWGNEYRYLHRLESPYADHNNSKFGYDLWSLGPDGADNTEDDLNNWTSSQ